VTATHPFNVFNDFNHESLATRYFTSRVVEHGYRNINWMDSVLIFPKALPKIQIAAPVNQMSPVGAVLMQSHRDLEKIL
jgi:hypothetical protein